jgi:hypothetical protein
MGGPLPAPEQYRSRAQGQPVAFDFDEAFLLDADPVGEQAQFYPMDDRIPRNS